MPFNRQKVQPLELRGHTSPGDGCDHEPAFSAAPADRPDIGRQDPLSAETTDSRETDGRSLQSHPGSIHPLQYDLAIRSGIAVIAGENNQELTGLWVMGNLGVKTFPGIFCLDIQPGRGMLKFIQAGSLFCPHTHA